MAEEKFSIVKVNEFCSSWNVEKIKDYIVCERASNCKECLYGLTKKQLIQIVRQSLKNNFKRGTTFLYLAEKIINDLGV